MSSVDKKANAVAALKYIIPILEKYKFKWCISGALACYLYGVKRPIGTIDIDVETSKDDPKFKELVEEIKEFTVFPFQLWIDKNYDNWVVEIIVNKQRISICPTKEFKLFNEETGMSELFYRDGIPEPIITDFEGLKIPLAPKESVLRLKQSLAHKKKSDLKDIAGMEKIISS